MSCRSEVTIVKLALTFVFCLCLLPAVLCRAESAGISGKYTRYYSSNGATKVVRDEYLDFQADGRCVCRALETDGDGAKHYTIVVASYEVVGDYVELSGDFGFETYEIRGSRLVSGDSGYIKGTPPFSKNPSRKPSKKRTKHFAKSK